MFCFETALKALYWSILVYRYEQSAPDQTRDPIKVRPNGIASIGYIIKQVPLPLVT